MNVQELMIENSLKKLSQQTDRIAGCLGRLSDEQIWQRGGDHENAVGNLVLHLVGNVRQWILSGLGGHPDKRERELEFSTRQGQTGAALTALLRGVIEDATGVIGKLTEAQLTSGHKVFEREYSGVEIVLHVTEHFGYHAGQIVFATKALTGAGLK